MKLKYWWIVVPVLGIIIYLSIPTQPIQSQPTTIDSSTWVRWKNDKNETLKTSEESPIENKSTFSGLTYFAYNPSFIDTFQITKAAKVQKVAIQMTDGTKEEMVFFGTVSGKIAGETVKLLLYQHENGDFFLPFKDKTAPQETYGGGRYLDIPLSNLHDSGILIDFNYAYNPFCVYNKSYTCPVPPKENQLVVRIEAGEKLTPPF